MSERDDLEEALRSERREREEADERAQRASARATEAEEAYRKLQGDLVAARDETMAARKTIDALEERLDALAKRAASKPPPRPASKPPTKPPTKPPSKPPSDAPARASAKPPAAAADEELRAQLEQTLEGIETLRQVLARTRIELSELQAEENALAKKRSRVLSEACALLASAIGETGQAPPALPLGAIEARLTTAPAVDISEVAELLESLRPPPAPKVD
jgi:hypothetical protein